MIIFLCFSYCNSFSKVIVSETRNDNEKINISEEFNLNNNTERNLLYFEMFGNGVFYSIAYERFLMRNNNNTFALATGFSYIPNLIQEHSFLFSPQIKYYIGLGDNKPSLVLGGGMTSYIPREKVNEISDFAYFIFYRIGLYYNQKDNNTFYSFALTPFTLNNPNGLNFKIMPYIGISFGKKF